MHDTIVITSPLNVIDRELLKKHLSELFPTEIKKVNLLLIAYDENIVTAIEDSNELDNPLFGKWKDYLINNYGISADNAEWTVDYWFSTYGVEVCKKKYARYYKNHLSNKEDLTQRDEGINVSKLRAGAKLPEERIEKIIDLSNEIGTVKVKCTARRGYVSGGTTSIDFDGEIYAQINQDILMVIMLYNACNELMAFDSDFVISKTCNGNHFFSISLRVPSDECISKAVVRIMIAPKSDTWEIKDEQDRN